MPNRLLSPGDSATRSLDAQIRELLARMSVLSEVPAARTGDIVHGGEQSTAPKGPRRSMYDEFHARYQGARSDRARRLVIEEAEQAYERATKMQIPAGKEPEYGSPLWKAWVAESTDDVGEIARKFNVTRQYVTKIRIGYRDAA